MADKKPLKNNPKQKERKLTMKEKAFCREYAKTGNGTQSIIKAGYKAKNDKVASVTATRLLGNPRIQAEIVRITGAKEKKAIMDAQEVMEHFTAIARGEEKDQFGLDISADTRLKALTEIAKRTVDLDNRANGKADSVVEIKLDWGVEEDTE